MSHNTQERSGDATEQKEQKKKGGGGKKEKSKVQAPTRSHVPCH